MYYILVVKFVHLNSGVIMISEDYVGMVLLMVVIWLFGLLIVNLALWYRVLVYNDNPGLATSNKEDIKKHLRLSRWGVATGLVILIVQAAYMIDSQSIIAIMLLPMFALVAIVVILAWFFVLRDRKKKSPVLQQLKN